MEISEIEAAAMRHIEDFTHAFYRAAQEVIDQTDGGLAAQYESGDIFRNGLGREILITIAAVVGPEEFERQASSLMETSNVHLLPTVRGPSNLTEENIPQVSPKVVDRFINSVVKGAFRRVPDGVLDRFNIPLVFEAEAYLKFEMAMASPGVAFSR